MKLFSVNSCDNFILKVITEEGTTGYFDITPYLESEIFHPLKDKKEFERFHNRGYFIEWDCGADLSADTIEAHLYDTRKN